MANTDDSHDGFNFQFPGIVHWKRLLIVWGVLVVVVLVVFALTWSAFFTYVPPGKHLIITAKDGTPLDENELLAEPGQKGIQREVKGEGWHFVLPIAYSTELGDNTIIPPGKLGILTSKGGKPLPPGQELAEEGQKGIRRGVLTPGTYRLNLKGFDVELVEAVEIPPGYVGVLQRKLGSKPASGRFAAVDSDEKGIIKQVLQPGLYYINTREYLATKIEVGIQQTSFHLPKGQTNQKDTSISFVCKGGFSISVDCTVEWEILPENIPDVLAEYGTWAAVEEKVIDVQAHAIGRDKGSNYGVQDFLEGQSREQFQADFTTELTKVCKDKFVKIHSAFIRRIDIPPKYLEPIREKQLAHETQLTTRAKELTAQTENELEREERMVDQEVARVEAETKVLVGKLDQEISNVKVLTEAQLEKIKADYANKIAAVESQRRKVTGEAAAEATKMKETAKSQLYQLKMSVFQNDAAAYLKYTLAEQLNPKIVVRLFQAGQGTLWTNMDTKGFNLMLPAPTAPSGQERKTKPVSRGTADDAASKPAESDTSGPAKATGGDSRRTGPAGSSSTDARR